MSVIGRLLWTSALVFLLAGLASSEVLPKVRKFIQVSDFHYDERYEAGAQVKGKFCHSSDTKVTNASDPVAGKYGDFRCDAPSVLVKSAIEAMHRQAAFFGQNLADSTHYEPTLCHFKFGYGLLP